MPLLYKAPATGASPNYWNPLVAVAAVFAISRQSTIEGLRKRPEEMLLAMRCNWFNRAGKIKATPNPAAVVTDGSRRRSVQLSNKAQLKKCGGLKLEMLTASARKGGNEESSRSS